MVLKRDIFTSPIVGSFLFFFSCFEENVKVKSFAKHLY